MATSLDLARTYTSFSGVDIKAIIQGEPVGSMQAISYAVQREKAPIYVMGRVDPLSFSRGKRGIAGTMISLLLDKHLIYQVGAFKNSQYIADKDEIYPTASDLNSIEKGNLDDLNNEILGPQSFNASDVSSNFSGQTPAYVDQILPFDIAVVAVNEYGKAATMRIYGVEILNEGSGFSIDDVVIENQMTYVCRTILPWQQMGEWGLNRDGSGKFQGFTLPTVVS